MSDCLFCKIISGEIPSDKVYEDDICLAFNDIEPQAPTHFLVIPKQHIGSIAEVNADNSAVVAHIFEVIAQVAKEKSLESYRVVSNIGEQAGQSVPHLHFHVLRARSCRPGTSGKFFVKNTCISQNVVIFYQSLKKGGPLPCASNGRTETTTMNAYKTGGKHPWISSRNSKSSS